MNKDVLHTDVDSSDPVKKIIKKVNSFYAHTIFML